MGCCEDYLTCDIAFNAVMPLSRASTRRRYSRIEGVTETIPEAPQGDLPDSGSRGGGAPESSEFGPQPNTAPDPPTAPSSGRRSPSKEGETHVPVTSVHPEAPDTMLKALRSASIEEEHRTIMSAVIQKVQSAKSGLTEACASLLTGFEVSF